MLTVTKLDEATVKVLTDRVAKHLETMAVAGITFSVAGGSFNDLEVTLRVKLTLTGEAKKRAERAQFEALAHFLDLEPAHWGKQFRRAKDPDLYRVAGIDLTNREFPLVVERVSDGKRFGFPKIAAIYVKGASE